MYQQIIASGPWAGAKALVFVPAPRFPFQKLPVELREMIYDEVAGTKGTISIGETQSRYQRSQYRYDDRAKWTALLFTNRAISREARKSFYVHKHFVFNGMQKFITFMRQIGDARRFLTKLTVKRSSMRLLHEGFTQLLHTRARLQSFTFNLPTDFKGTLVEHINESWKTLGIYLLGDSADLTESLERLDRIVFAAGSRQGVTRRSGAPIGSITPDIKDLCKRRLRKRLLVHHEATV